jgi:glucose uptake protein GlcU
MKKGKRATLGLLVFAYAFGIVLAVMVFGSQARYDCYTRNGISGIFWCPGSVNEVALMLLIRKSVIWPYYAYRAVRS